MSWYFGDIWFEYRSTFQPIETISIATIRLIISATGRPDLTPQQIEGVEDKFRRYTEGRFIPPSGSFMFKLALLDYIGFVLLLARAYDLANLARKQSLRICCLPYSGVEINALRSHLLSSEYAIYTSDVISSKLIVMHSCFADFPALFLPTYCQCTLSHREQK
jgi:hypothetical protein